jgi:hypothetical protein
VWSIGAILHELVSGRPPFEAETLPALCVMIATATALPPSAWRGDVPPGLDAVVARCLEKRREDRFGSVALLAQALAAFAPQRSQISIERASRILREGGPIEPGPGVGAAAEPEIKAVWPPAATDANWGRSGPHTARRRTAIVATVLGMLVGLGTGLYGWTRVIEGHRAPTQAGPVDPKSIASLPMREVLPPVPSSEWTPAPEVPAISRTGGAGPAIAETSTGVARKIVPPLASIARLRADPPRSVAPTRPAPTVSVAGTPAASSPPPPKADYDQM